MKIRISLILSLIATSTYCSQAFVVFPAPSLTFSRPSRTVSFSSSSDLEEPAKKIDNVAETKPNASSLMTEGNDDPVTSPPPSFNEAAAAATPPAPQAPSPTPVAPTTPNPKTKQENMLFLNSLGAISGRGEFATKQQHVAAQQVVQELERVNPTPQPACSQLVYGRWELCYCSTQLFRSSPFFMAGRAVCQTDRERDQYNWFCDLHRAALAISTIQAVRQIVTRTGRLVSEFEVQVGAVPFGNNLLPFFSSYSGGLPVAVEGALVSSADFTSSANGTAWELYMDTVEIKGSNLPLLRRVLDSGVKLESRRLASVLEQAVPAYTTPRPVFTTTYLDESLRISRDQDGNIFCYTKTSDQDDLTDYTNKESDLGLLKLLRGFNDAVTKIYL